MFSLIRRNPFCELSHFEREADRFFRNFFDPTRFPSWGDGSEMSGFRAERERLRRWRQRRREQFAELGKG